ncbi:MAG TPA: hypothetical protein DDY71_06340 [Spirochaetia bacterium]|nr:MAG: hypothetical protein A2Y30_16675 [Spirochaetes bacterium GWE1_32_154]HBI37248.1 hypothetical protein [Spirochaetia bacterium]
MTIISKIIYAFSKICSKTMKFHRNYKKYKQDPYFQAQYRNNTAGALLYNGLINSAPFIAARLGAYEINCLKEFIVSSQIASIIKMPDDKVTFSKKLKDAMENNTGFFPPTDINLVQFSKLLLSDITSVDVLGSFMWEETLLKKELQNAKKIPLYDIEPFKHDTPWTVALAGKKVLVIHPFEDTIRYQYEKRNLWLKNRDFCPDFELITLKAVQSVAGCRTEFASWFDALHFMENKINAIDFDIAIIGCGAYGLPLAAHIKRLGKKAIHMGGATQLLFGILGKRWEDNNSFLKENIFNEYWIRPLDSDKPSGFQKVEGGCYW